MCWKLIYVHIYTTTKIIHVPDIYATLEVNDHQYAYKLEHFSCGPVRRQAVLFLVQCKPIQLPIYSPIAMPCSTKLAVFFFKGQCGGMCPLY